MTTAEIIRHLPIDQYHLSDHVSHSKLRDYAERGARYYHDRHVARTIPHEETDAFRLGQAFETLFQLGKDAFERTYAIKPEAARDGRTVAGKAFKAAAGTKTIVDQAEYDALCAMVESMRGPELADAMRLVAACEPQVSFRGELHGVKVQARPDYVCLDPDAPFIMDLKTTRNLNDLLVDLDQAGPTIWKLGYHSQLAFCRRLMAQAGFPQADAYLLVVEKQLPYRAACIDIGELLDWGEVYLDTHLPRLGQCIRTSDYPRCPRGIVRVARPRWAPTPKAA